MGKHTPGKWVIGIYGTDIRDEHGYELASVEAGDAILAQWEERYPEFVHWASGPEGTTWIERSEEEAEANARLIAAAPHLLAILAEILDGDWLRPCNPQDYALLKFAACPREHPNCCGFCEMRFRIADAIAQAEGRFAAPPHPGGRAESLLGH